MNDVSCVHELVSLDCKPFIKLMKCTPKKSSAWLVDMRTQHILVGHLAANFYVVHPIFFFKMSSLFSLNVATLLNFALGNSDLILNEPNGN